MYIYIYKENICICVYQGTSSNWFPSVSYQRDIKKVYTPEHYQAEALRRGGRAHRPCDGSRGDLFGEGWAYDICMYIYIYIYIYIYVYIYVGAFASM